MKALIFVLAIVILTGCARKDIVQGPEAQTLNQVKKNRIAYAKDIREATNECLSSVRNNPQVQNYNDDNEIVKTCTEYALKLYNAYWSELYGAA